MSCSCVPGYARCLTCQRHGLPGPFGVTPPEAPAEDAKGRYRAYCMGFRHGVSATFPRGAHLPDYARGYADGRRAMAEASRKFSEEVGYDASLAVIDR